MKRLLLSLAVSLALLLAGCGAGGENSGVLLYFCTDPNDHSQLHGPAIQSQPYLGPSGPGVEELVNALLAGPTQRAVRRAGGHLPHPGRLLSGAHPQPGGGGGHRPDSVRRAHLPLPQPPDYEGG